MDLVYDQETQLAVAWIEPTSPNGVIRSYDVSYHRSSFELFNTATVGGQSSRTVLEGLTAYTTYTVRVLSYFIGVNDLDAVSSVQVRAVTIVPGNYSMVVTGRTDEGSRQS